MPRDAQGRFIKGSSGNPHGKKSIAKDIKDLAARAPEELSKMVDDENTPQKVREDILKWAYEMVHGKPKQTVDADVKTPESLSVKFEGQLKEWSE